jgi:dienelactone hydrolase
MRLSYQLAAAACVFSSTALLAQSAEQQAPPQPFGVIGAPAGTGPYPAVADYIAAMPEHGFYHPATLPKGKLPIVMWGNGGCRDNSLSAAQFLREVSSHGYFIVVAGPPRDERVPGPPPAGAMSPPAPANREAQLAQRGPDATSPELILAGLDWAIAQNANPQSRFYRHLDPARIAVMGHSCGGLQTIRVSADPRVKASVLFNSGVFNVASSGRSALSITKDELNKLHAPIAYIIGGPSDIAWPQAIDDVARITHVPLFFGHSNIGHGGTFWSAPNGGEYAQIAVNWLDFHLKGKASAGRMFRSRECGLCRTPGWTVPRSLY